MSRAKVYDFYGSRSSFRQVVNKVKLFCRDDRAAKLTVEYPKPARNIEYYQCGLKRMSITLESSKKNIHLLARNLNNIFTSEEESRLLDYTPVLRSLIDERYFKKKVLSDCLVIFREHSLISVYNIFHIFRELGLRPENAVYYSKGDRCRNIFRIEESLRNRGYGVFVLSPFEAISPTGRSEDERIVPEASKRVYGELKPYFDKAKKENLKIIVFDDGGLMVTTVIDLFGCDYDKLIYGYIETTKGGMHAINSRCDLKVTVVNLADCSIKKLLNAVIGHSIVQRLREMIPHVGLRGQSVVVVGYGTLGRAIAKDLRRLGMSVYVCDNDNEKVFEASTDGFAVSKDPIYLIKNFRPILIMGCTGMDALNYQNLSKVKRDTYIATVSSNEIKQSYPKFDSVCRLDFIDNFARIYTLPSKKKLYILGNGASLNLYNGEGANHSEYQPFLAAMVESIVYAAINGPVKGKPGLDTEIADRILDEANILGKYLKLSNSLIG